MKTILLSLFLFFSIYSFGQLFGSQQSLTVGVNQAHDVYSTDLDGDGDMDVLSASWGDDKIAWYENDGNGNFGSQQVITTDADRAFSVYATDLDGDGDMDVLSASEWDDKIAWYENDGNGNFGDQQVITTEADGPSSAYAADLDGDGDMDVLSTSTNDHKIAWYENDGNGNFGDQQVITTGADEAESVYAADLDGDGDMDVLSALEHDHKIAWYENDGNGNFGDQQDITIKANGAESVYATDLDGDGDMDMLSASFWDNKIAWYENDGNGNFGLQQVFISDANRPSSAYAADLDGDGDMDVLSASEWDDKIAWYENDGNGNVGSQQIITTEADNARSVYAADLDGDGDMDVLSASWLDDKIAWYENDGNGIFGDQNIITTDADEAQSVFATDLDGDGDMDVLSASSEDGKIAWYENDGNGIFGSQQVITTEADGAESVYATDLDGDGDMDVLSASKFDDKVAWYENDGNGIFGSQQVITIDAGGARSVYSADLDGDGDMDVLSASGDDKIAWYENDGNGIFGSQQVITTDADGARSVYATDLNGDGDMDVLSASYNDAKVAWYENLTGNGCLDTEACNFDSNAWVDDDSCCYAQCGCTDPLAENYSESATCENGSCVFQINGLVFYDENENGVMDEEEYGLPFQNVSIEALNFITNDEGVFIADIGSEQLAAFELQENPVFPFNTTTNPVLFDAMAAESTNVMFGISNEEPLHAVCIDLYPNGNGFLCNDYTNHNMCFRNMGNVPIDGIIELEYDELFQGHQEVTPIDSVDGNTVYMSFENLLPGEMFFYDIELLTPTVDHIGEFVTSVAKVYGFYEDDQVAYGEQELTMEIACAYDPNDKQAFPLGYTDEHWLLPETEQEFLVRFQNTGNAPAQDVRIQDTIDVNYDLSTFRMVANSHSVMTSINEETRVIDFFFQDIQLPDSVNNEPDSHGLVSYAITPFADLPIGTELNNTAFIYFDNNEAIVTNTTWTTIHECGGEAAFEASASQFCVGETIDFISTYEQIETHQWNIDAAPENAEDSFSKTFTESGEYIVQLVAENPLCSASSMQMITVHETPSADFSGLEVELCEGESLELEAMAEAETSYQWSLEGEIIGNAAELVHSLETTGELEIMLAVQNENCIAEESQTVTVYENPSADFSVSSEEICLGEDVEFSSLGENIETHTWTINEEAVVGDQTIQYLFGETGEHQVELSTQNGICTDIQSQTITVYETPTVNFTQEGDLLTASEGETYQWLLNGEIIEGATAQEHSVTEDGTYSVAVTNGGICTAESEGIMIVGISELDSKTILLYPNPMTEVAFLEFEDSGIRTVKLLDASGKLVRSWNSVKTQKLEIHKQDLAAGNYIIQVHEGSEASSVKLVVR